MSGFDFNGKTFRVVRNDGPGAEVTTATRFHFRQFEQDGRFIVHADYEGGEVAFGKLVGVLNGSELRHSYVQVNRRGEFHRGNSTNEISRTAAGKLQLIDRWRWETKEGSGLCILEEV